MLILLDSLFFSLVTKFFSYSFLLCFIISQNIHEFYVPTPYVDHQAAYQFLNASICKVCSSLMWITFEEMYNVCYRLVSVTIRIFSYLCDVI